MIKRNKLKFLIVIVAIIIFYGIYKFSSFSLFEENLGLKVIETINLSDKEYGIKIYYIPSNAVTQSNIQVRKVQGDLEEILHVYERYNFLESHERKKDSLFITVNDTSRIRVKAKKFGIKLP